MPFFKKIPKILKKKSVIFLLILLILGGGFFYFVHSLSKPALGVIKPNDEQPQGEVFTQKTFTNKYFLTKYSSRYEIQQNKNASASLISWIMLAHQSVGGNIGSKIAVIVTNVPVGGTKEDSAYKRFEAFPDKFKITKITYNMDQVFVATGTDQQFEQTALWAHGKFLLTISMTAGAKTDQLLAEMDTILSNLKWVDQ